MAKVEFIKETSIDGESIYFTEVDGQYVSNTSSLDYEDGRKKYIAYIKGKRKDREVLETIEIDLNIL